MAVKKTSRGSKHIMLGPFRSAIPGPAPQPQGDLDVQRPPPFAPSSPRRRHVSALAFALLALLIVLRPGVARAQSRVNEGAARALEKKAMEDDYLNTDFDKAAEKLNQAIAKCGTDKCGVPVRSQLKRDLAAVQSAAGHKDLALAAMTEAFKNRRGPPARPELQDEGARGRLQRGEEGGRERRRLGWTSARGGLQAHARHRAAGADPHPHLRRVLGLRDLEARDGEVQGARDDRVEEPRAQVHRLGLRGHDAVRRRTGRRLRLLHPGLQRPERPCRHRR